MKVIWAAVLGLLLSLTCLAETKTNQVWNSGSTIYGQATLSNGLMANHTFTTKVRFVNVRTGVGTSWVTKTTLNSTTNINKIAMARPSVEDNYRFEAQYTVVCPKGIYDSYVNQITLFTIGYTLNCLHLVTGTGQRDAYGNWYALYSKTPGCAGHCLVADRIGFTSAGSQVGPDLYVSMRYWWLYVTYVGTFCLDAYEANRLACNSCGDYAR